MTNLSSGVWTQFLPLYLPWSEIVLREVAYVRHGRCLEMIQAVDFNRWLK